MVRRITNSIRPVDVASLLAKGEAQDAKVRGRTRGDSCGKPRLRKSVQRAEDVNGWLETERLEGSVTVSRDPWSGPESGVHAEWAEEPQPTRGQSARSSQEAG